MIIILVPNISSIRDRVQTIKQLARTPTPSIPKCAWELGAWMDDVVGHVVVVGVVDVRFDDGMTPLNEKGWKTVNLELQALCSRFVNEWKWFAQGDIIVSKVMSPEFRIYIWVIMTF